MSKKVLLVSEAQVKNQSIIEKNVDGKLLSKVIANVQEINLKPILGKVLYESVKEEVSLLIASGTTLSTSTQTLLEEYIQPYLINQVLVDFIVVNNYKISNKGMMKMRDDSSDNVSDSEMEFVKNYFENYTASYKSNLIQYLADNNLVQGSCSATDTDITSGSTGWFLN